MNRLLSTAITRGRQFPIYHSIHSARTLLSLPSHKIIPMPALSPTMESGSIAKWNMKEGDRFEPGQAICDVETDKATVTYDAQDEGYIAKILIGTGEVKVGQPLMIVVDEASDVTAFKDYSSPTVSASVVAPSVPSTPTESPSVPPSLPSPLTTTGDSSLIQRIFVSPYAKKLATESGVSLSSLNGSGPSGRIIAADVLNKNLKPSSISPPAPISVTAPIPATITTPSPSTSAPVVIDSSILSHNIYQDFIVTDMHQQLATRFTHAKQVVPHYYLSVDMNLSKLLALRDELNGSIKGKSISVLDLLIKATAKAVLQVPDVNGSWMDTFVRRYEQVDINVVIGSGNGLVAPVLRDINSKGLVAISQEVSMIEESLVSKEALPSEALSLGTFTVHNLGMFGVKSAAPIVLPPQACALAFGVISDQVIPNSNAKQGEDNWQVAPMMTATMSCDHRVVDGAVSAQYLQAFKSIVEDPVSLLL